MKISEKFEDLYYKIERISPIRNIKYGIKNLIKWFVVIWNDRNWDFFFIWVILHKKLELMEKEIRNNGHHVNHIRDAEQIKLCVNLLKRLIDDDYHENVFKNHDKKWGQSHMKWEPTKDPELTSLHIIRDNANTDEEKEQETKEFRILGSKVEQLKQQDINYLFDYMKKHIQCWWD